MTPAAPSLRTNTAWCLLGNIVARGNIFFALILIKQVFAPAAGNAEAGRYTLALATASAIFSALAQPVTTLHTTDTLRQHTIGDYLGLRMVLWAPAWALTAGIALYYGGAMGAAIIAAGGMKWSESLNETIYGELQQNRRNDLVTQSQILRGGLTLAGMIAAVLTGGGAALIFLAMTLANLAVFYLHDRTRLWRIHHESSAETMPALRACFDKRTLRAVLQTSLPLIAVVLVAMLSPIIPRYVLAKQFDDPVLADSIVGVYGMLFFFVLAMLQIIDALGRAASPYLAEAYATGRVQDFLALAGKLLGWAILLGTLGIVGGQVGSDWALGLTFGNDAARYHEELGMMMWVGGFYCVASMLGYIVTPMRRFGSLLVATLLSGGVTAWVSLTWIPRATDLEASFEATLLATGVYCIATIVCLSAVIVYAALTPPAKKD